MTTRPTSSTLAQPQPAPTGQAPISPALCIKLVVVAMLWGGTFIAGRVVAQAMPLMTAACGRFLVASILLLVLAFKTEGGLPRLDRSQAGVTALLGLTGIFLYNIFFLEALSRIPAGRTALFVSLNPIVTALAASVVFRECLGLRRWLGIAIALLGATIIITRGDLVETIRDVNQSIGLGEAMMFLAVLSWVAYTLLSRKALETLSPIAATTYGALWGLLFLSFGAAGEIGAIRWTALGWQAWVSILYLGAMGTVIAFVWYYQGIRAIGPSRTAVFNNLVPAFGVLLSAVLLGEDILASMIIGGVVAAFGVSLTNRAP